MLEPENTQGITIKVKLVLDESSDETKFIRTMEQYRKACNFISEHIFLNDFTMNQLKLQKEIYSDIRTHAPWPKRIVRRPHPEHGHGF